MKGTVAIDATIRAAAARQAGKRSSSLEIQQEDLREKVKRHRSPYLISFVVDNSWSVHVEATLEKVKEIALSFLKDAGFYGDRVAVVTFYHSRHPCGVLALPPTGSLSLAYRRLQEVPLSGSTPLPDAVHLASRVLKREFYKRQNAVPVMVLITDGLPTAASRPGNDPFLELEAICLSFRKEPFFTLVVDIASRAEGGESFCREIASMTQGQYLHISELTRGTLERSIDARPAPQQRQA